MAAGIPRPAPPPPSAGGLPQRPAGHGPLHGVALNPAPGFCQRERVRHQHPEAVSFGDLTQKWPPSTFAGWLPKEPVLGCSPPSGRGGYRGWDREVGPWGHLGRRDHCLLTIRGWPVNDSWWHFIALTVAKTGSRTLPRAAGPTRAERPPRRHGHLASSRGVKAKANHRKPVHRPLRGLSHRRRGPPKLPPLRTLPASRPERGSPGRKWFAFLCPSQRNSFRPQRRR